MLSYILSGLSTVLNPLTLLQMFFGSAVGIVFGAVPGLSVVMALVLLLPFTYTMVPGVGIAFLISVYIGATSGGLISAILLNIPGTPNSVATTFDGIPMRNQGKAYKALGLGIVFSCLGTIFSCIALMLISPLLAKIAIKFGPHEYFSVALFSIILVSSMAGRDLGKAFFAAFLGIAFSTIGLSPVDAVKRFTFGSPELIGGFSTLPMLIGLFAIKEILETSENIKFTKKEDVKIYEVEKAKGFGFSMKEFLDQKWNFLTSAVMGVVIGIIPGIGGSSSNLIAYDVVKIATNNFLAKKWNDLIDFNAGDIAIGQSTVEEKGEELLDYIVEVASGRKITKSDELGLYNALVVFNPAPITWLYNKYKIYRRRIMKIGFVGLGVMGKPMAKNLIKAGYELNVNTLEEEVVKEFEELGAKGYTSKKDLAQDSDVIILMLPNSPNCDQAIFGEDGLVEGLSEGKIIVDMSSINPVESKRFAKALEEKGVKFIDAPVSGGEPKAIDGTLAVMVGGDEKTFEEVKPIIEKMASSIVRTGEVGAGNTTKLANQIVVALNIAAVSEAFTLAKKAGVDPEAVYHAIRGGLAGSTVMDAKGPMMLERNFKLGFRIDLHIKDLQNALDTSHSVQASLPLTAGVMEILQALRIDGNEKDDHSAIVKYYEKINNLEVGENK